MKSTIDPRLTPAQAALRLGVSVWTFLRWCRDGKIHALKPGKRNMGVYETELKRFLKESVTGLAGAFGLTLTCATLLLGCNEDFEPGPVATAYHCEDLSAQEIKACGFGRDASGAVILGSGDAVAPTIHNNH